jgi:hypothetical protein
MNPQVQPLAGAGQPPLRRMDGIFTDVMAAGFGGFSAVLRATERLILYWMYRRKIFLTA